MALYFVIKLETVDAWRSVLLKACGKIGVRTFQLDDEQARNPYIVS